MNYDRDSISILKQYSFIDCNYLRAGKDESEVLQCSNAMNVIANCGFQSHLKVTVLVKLVP